MSPARPPRVPPLRFRAARRTDVETLADLGLRAYRVSSLEKRREFYTDHPRFSLRDVRVGEVDGQIVASMVLYPFTAFVRGQRVPRDRGRIGGRVPGAPPPRHRRDADAPALREMRQNGHALTMLYAFRGAYYRKLGYGMVEVVHQLAISPGQPAGLRRGARRCGG